MLMALKDQNWLRRHQHTLVYLGSGGGGALSNTFFVSLFSYFTVIFKFPDIIYNISNIISYNILIKFLEFNYLNYWILLSISLIHIILFIKYKNYIDKKINYYNDININNIMYHIIFVTTLYIIGTITQFNIFIFWAINHIIINLLFIIYLYINYIYALYTIYTIKISNLAILNSLALEKDELIGECKSYYRKDNGYSIIDYFIAINFSYIIIGSYMPNAQNVKYIHYLYTTKNITKPIVSNNQDINKISYLPGYKNYSYIIVDILLNIKSKYIKDIIISIIRSIISK